MCVLYVFVCLCSLCCVCVCVFVQSVYVCMCVYMCVLSLSVRGMSTGMCDVSVCVLCMCRMYRKGSNLNYSLKEKKNAKGKNEETGDRKTLTCITVSKWSK